MKRNIRWLVTALIAGSAGLGATGFSQAECGVQRTTIRTYEDGAFQAYMNGEPVRLTRTTWVEERPAMKADNEKIEIVAERTETETTTTTTTSASPRWIVETSGPTTIERERDPRLAPVGERFVRPSQVVYTDEPLAVAEGPLEPVAERRTVRTTTYRKVSSDKSDDLGERTKRTVKKTAKKTAKKTGRTLEKGLHKTGEKLEYVGEKVSDFFDPAPRRSRATTTTTIIQREPGSMDAERVGPWYPNAEIDYDNPYR